MITALIADDEPLARQRIVHLLQPHADISVLGQCGDGEAVVDRLSNQPVDLVFLDVQMPGIDGLGVVELIPEGQLPVIIFVTAHDEYALRAFQLHALDYLLKPVEAEAFDRALARARTHLLGRVQEKHMAELRSELRGGPYRRRVALRNRDRIVVVRVEEIRWIETQGNYIRVHTDRGAFLLRESLREFAATLDPERFIRISRSGMVNVDGVAELRLDRKGRLRVVLTDSTVVPVGAAHRAQVETVLGVGR